MTDYKQIILYCVQENVLGQHATTCLTNSGQQWAWQGKKLNYKTKVTGYIIYRIKSSLG